MTIETQMPDGLWLTNVRVFVAEGSWLHIGDQTFGPGTWTDRPTQETDPG